MKFILGTIASFFISLSILFLALEFIPGDMAERLLGPDSTEVERTKLREEMGLNRPFLVRFSSYWKGAIKLDFGTSYFKKKKVKDLILKALGPTLTIGLGACLFSFFLGPFFGVLSALSRGGRTDYVIRMIGLGVLSVPVFALGPLLVLLLSIKLNLLPVSEWKGVSTMVLPILTLGLPLGAIMSRFSRNAFLEELISPWTSFLRAKGLSETSINLRIFKAISPSLINIFILQLSVVLAGTLITENIFDIPGLGGLLLTGIQNRDLPVIMGCVSYSAILYLTLMKVGELVNSLIDPRIGKE